MEYIVSASTDVGIKKSTNQDSLTVKVAKTDVGNIVMAVVCDGMGGLAQGEVASADLIRGFLEWFNNRLPYLLNNPLEDHIVRQEWEHVISESNQRIMQYGRRNGINLGTTVVAMLFTDTRYYVVNVGDSRAYELSNQVNLLTEDQTVVQKELKQGLLTPEQAMNDPRRSVLLQCVGVAPNVYPEMFFGETKKDAVYMMCSDGFRHVISEDEIYQYLGPDASVSTEEMKKNSEYLINLNKQRNEEDNISVLLVRTY